MKMGSAGKTALVYVIMLSLLLGTAAFIQFQASATIVKADVEIRPDRVDLGAEELGVFKFFLTFSGKYKNYKVADINRTTVRIEGIVQPREKPWHIKKDNTLRFHVTGYDLVYYVIWSKIYHMARIDPNPYKGTWFPYNIDITVTGKFYSGEQFSGTDRIKAYAPQGTVYPPPGELP